MNRMSLWRTKKTSQEAGRLTQVGVWAPEQDAELVRNICNRVAEPTARGAELRCSLLRQLDRRRTTYAKWDGGDWQAEIDYPLVGPWWFMQNIGGRITGADGTHVELSPEEATDLKDYLRSACNKAIEAWATKNKMRGCVRDSTGVVTEERVVLGAAGKDPNRPADENAFAMNEAMIARSVAEAARAPRKPSLKDPSVVEYEGFFGVPSFCQVAHRKHGDRVQFALIHMANSGTSPTNMFGPLATFMRQRFYPNVDACRIDWFDVFPPGVYHWTETVVHSVDLKQANGVYSDPTWNPVNPDENADWIALINQIIARGQKTREAAEAAPRNAKKPVPR